ncbi:uncharacterized protein [Macrobrachium rosenbergii]|uniref:uncharacterized protein n=1 Tax=Macrobrachium rosenbergii TaxID=79674 RepID=UPI0034D3E69C
MMSLTGYPQRIRTDGGPQFSAAEFQRFLKGRGIKWSPSSPHFPSSNGHAEVIVKKVKNLLTKLENATMDERFHEALLELRNTPNADGRSPNQVVFGHNLRSLVPSHHSALMSDSRQDIEAAEMRRREKERINTTRYNASATDLKVFIVGDKVRIQDAATKEWDRIGEIVKVGPRNRCYFIRLSSSGKLCWRNRRYLRKYHGGDIKEETYTSVDELESEGPRRSNRLRKNTVRFVL